MSDLVHVSIHPSQFPAQVQSELIRSLQTRQINHKFHYDSVKQTHHWLSLHQAYSPSRTDADCAAMYDRAFAEAAAGVSAPGVDLIGLGCGGGQKDTRLLKLLHASGRQVSYTPVDVSTAMVLVARETALQALPDLPCSPIVCDLALAENVAEVLSPGESRAARLITLFGMLPNFEPGDVMPRLVAALRTGDLLLLSANLAPGPDYLEGIRHILPLYDNTLTREWLMAFLLDLGVERTDGQLRFTVESSPSDAGLKRVVAHFCFSSARRIQVGGEEFAFARGDSVRLFFSNRHTPELIRSMVAHYQLELIGEWIARSGEEGVFLLRSAARPR